jgi:predicted DNA-binding antitoxin AbrB/MazE fold protein
MEDMYNVQFYQKGVFIMIKKVNFEERILVKNQTKNELQKIKLNFEARTRNWPSDKKQELAEEIEKEIVRTLVNRYLYK